MFKWFIILCTIFMMSARADEVSIFSKKIVPDLSDIYHTSDECSVLPFVLEEATISSVQTAIKCHQITCVQLVKAYVERIKNYNLSVAEKALLNAIARINPNVFEQAQLLDDIFASGQWKGPLHCVPVLLKDNIDSYDSPSSSSSLALLGNQPIKDAFLTQKLRDAGAVILGKATMDEFASGISGISSANGRVGNAYDTTQSPGGSSSGVAVGISANFALVGIGTDNSGSIRIPAAFNGIVGLRPTMGLISQQGIFPRGNMDGTAGPMTRTVEDLAKVLDVIAQPDTADKKTLQIFRPSSYISSLDVNALKNKRIGVIVKLNNLDIFHVMSSENIAAFNIFLNHLRDMGAEVVMNVELKKFDLSRKYNQTGEREDVNAYLASYPAVRKDYYDICESERTIVFGSSMECDQFVRDLPKKFSKEYRAALNEFSKNSLYIKSFMQENHLDALVLPISTTGSVTYDSKALIGEVIASNAGLPSIAFTIGYTQKSAMPISVELIGKEYSEGELLGMTYAYEKQTTSRLIPPLPESSNFFDAMTIDEYNNFLNIIGYTAYQTILSQCHSDKWWQCLTATKFRDVVREEERKNVL